MEAANSNNSKQKPRVTYAESNSSGASNSGDPWLKNHPEHRREQRKYRERGRDQWNRDKSLHGKRENSRDDESQERYKEEPQLAPNSSSTYPAFNFPNSDRAYMDKNHHDLSMMSYNMMAAAAMNNTQLRVNTLDGESMTQSNVPSTSTMPTTMEKVQATNTSLNPFNFMNMPGVNPFNLMNMPGVNPFNFMNMPGDFRMMGMNNFGIVGQFGMVSGQENMIVPPVKEVIHLSKGVLLPPSPNAPSPSTREKPMGCKTVFVGFVGLPEKITDEIIKEIFEKAGEIDNLRMSKMKFCHIRFKEASSVERALYYSGYRLKIENNDEPPYTGRLHVDYAVARDDQYEYECHQRMLQRAARHQERDDFRSVTPPIIDYNEHEATVLAEKLRNEETFLQAACVLTNWLERGECSKRNAGTFYSMIQSTNSQVRRLITEKGNYEEELNNAREKLKKYIEEIAHQFYEIEKVFKAALLQKVWDHFTKGQRKNIELWKKQTEEIKNAHVEEVINEREGEEMDLSDDENEETTIQSPSESVEELKNQFKEEVAKLREENDSLRCQLEVSQNEIVVLQAENAEQFGRQEQRISSSCAAIQNSKKRCKDESQQDYHSLKTRRTLVKDDDSTVNLKEFDFDDSNLGPVCSSSADVSISENDVRLLVLVSIFLYIHPFGANIDYICSFLQQINSSIHTRDVENLMKRYPTVFREDSTGIGASLGKKWSFLGFES